MKDTEQLYLERIKAWAMAKAWLKILDAAATPVLRTPAEQARFYGLISDFIETIEGELNL